MRRTPAVRKCVDAAFPRRRHVRWTMTSQQILNGVRAGTVFGMIECDIRVPEELRAHFAEMQPVFKNISLIREDLGPFMRRYAEEHDIMKTPRRMLVGSYCGDKILLATPLLRWYLDHGLEVLHVYQVIEYDPIPSFRRFGDAVSKARREGDVHQDKTIIADTMKLLGNSGYGKTITNVDRHRDVSYCTEKAASLLVNDKRFRQLDIVVDDAYEIELNKKTVKYTLPVHVGFFVLQYAKMRMLQFYYDFIIRYVERPLFEYCEMDTDSAYLALVGESVDDLVTPALREHYFRHRSEWLPSECCDDHRTDYVRCRLANRPWVGDEACCKARRAFDKRTPGRHRVDILPDLMRSYNNTPHRMIGMAPSQVIAQNQEQVWQRLYGHDGKGVPKLHVSDRVRVSKYKRTFEKGYETNWSEELFTIHEVHPSDPPVYRLRDDLGEVLEGTFYELELQKVTVTFDKVYRVEAVLKRRTVGRRKEALVKWFGYSSYFNSWIDARGLVNYKA